MVGGCDAESTGFDVGGERAPAPSEFAAVGVVRVSTDVRGSGVSEVRTSVLDIRVGRSVGFRTGVIDEYGTFDGYCLAIDEAYRLVDWCPPKCEDCFRNHERLVGSPHSDHGEECADKHFSNPDHRSYRDLSPDTRVTPRSGRRTAEGRRTTPPKLHPVLAPSRRGRNRNCSPSNGPTTSRSSTATLWRPTRTNLGSLRVFAKTSNSETTSSAGSSPPGRWERARDAARRRRSPRDRRRHLTDADSRREGDGEG